MAEQIRWRNPAMWLVALLVVNSLWSAVASQEAPNEVNSPSQTETYREIVVAPVAELDRALPARMEVSFSAPNTESGAIGYIILLNNETKVVEWRGNLGDEVPQWSGTLEPGTYTIETVVDEGIVAQQELFIRPFEAYQLEGHIVLSLLLVFLAFTEQGIRALAKKYKQPEVSDNQELSPFKKMQSGGPDLEHVYDQDSPWREPLR